MNNRIKQLCASRLITNKRGAAALIAIVIVTALIVVISVGYAFTAIGNLEFGFAKQKSNDVVLTAESCVEEAMLRLSSDNTYSGGSLTVGDVACTMTVTGTPCGSCTIDVAATSVGFTRNIQAGVTVSGSSVDITSWEEVD